MKTRGLISVCHALLHAVLALATGPCVTAAIYTNFVAPNNLANIEGNSWDYAPFTDSANTVRYQEVFNSSEFSAIDHGGGLITGIVLRADSPSQFPFAVTVSNLQINLSTTAKSADHLSTVFSQNVGDDDMVVRAAGPAYLSGGGNPGTPQLFYANIMFDRAYYYNPQAGNLLLDVRNYSGVAIDFSRALDAADTVGDSISRVFALSTYPSNGVNALSGTADSRGLIVEFTVMPVPEPSPVQLLLLGGLPLAFWLRLRKSRKGGPR